MGLLNLARAAGPALSHLVCAMPPLLRCAGATSRQAGSAPGAAGALASRPPCAPSSCYTHLQQCLLLARNPLQCLLSLCLLRRKQAAAQPGASSEGPPTLAGPRAKANATAGGCRRRSRTGVGCAAADLSRGLPACALQSPGRVGRGAGLRGRRPGASHCARSAR